jgi:outer membrane protein OmpA-like peptidoglycan-associated protein
MPHAFVVSHYNTLHHSVRILITIVLFVFLCLFGSGLFAQSTYVPPKVPDKAIKTLDEAVLTAKTGHTAEAVASINALIEKYPTWTLPRQHISRIYYEAGLKQESLGALKATVAIDTASQLQQMYSMAKLYEELGLIDDALAAYKVVVMRTEEKSPLKTKAKDSCQALKAKGDMLKPKYSIDPKPFPAAINTDLHEANGKWSLDGSTMIFTRLIAGQEDIFIATFDPASKEYAITEFPFNSPSNEGAHAISPDGRYLIFTSCNRQDGMGSCDLYLSSQRNDGWTQPVNMGPAFNTPGYDGQPSFGVDGNTLFFSSNRDGGAGGRDIWYTYQVTPDEWSKPINAGPNVNTSNNEESPFVHFDGKSLFFMRDGKEGLGGYDIYMSRMGLDNKWQPAENLGAPINTTNDEGALSLHPAGTTAIITQVTGENKNDLFEIELPKQFHALPQQALVVNINDKASGKPVRANLDIFLAEGDPSMRLSQYADANGKITTSLQRNIAYGIIANAPDYLMHSSYMEADTSASRTITIEMVPIARSANASIVLRNVFFKTGSAAILPESETELNKLFQTLRTNRNMHIEISGHTDDVGDDDSNMELSKDRAKAVYEWLVVKGIESDRLSFKGYGETKPISSNATAEGKQLNRRTEFTVISLQ